MSNILGKKIIGIRPMTKKEAAALYWEFDEPVMVLELEGGSLLFPSRDYEGNGGGAIFGTDKTDNFVVHVDKKVTLKDLEKEDE